MTNKPLSSRALGLRFLIPGLVWGVPALLTGHFTGAALGFCTFAITFGLVMLLVSAVSPQG